MTLSELSSIQLCFIYTVQKLAILINTSSTKNWWVELKKVQKIELRTGRTAKPINFRLFFLVEINFRFGRWKVSYF